MNIIVSESKSATRAIRFCATLDGDRDLDRAGFGSSERSALWSLAKQLDIHPATLQVQATIERVGVR